MVINLRYMRVLLKFLRSSIIKNIKDRSDDITNNVPNLG